MKTAVESFQDQEDDFSPPSTPGSAAATISSPEGVCLLKLRSHFLFYMNDVFQELF